MAHPTADNDMPREKNQARTVSEKREDEVETETITTTRSRHRSTAQSMPPSAEGKPQRSATKSVLLVMSMTFAMIVNVANATAFAIALPTIQREMHLQEAELQWIVSAYPLSSGCLLIICGRLADLYGRKKTFLIGSFILAVFTLGCAFPKNAIALDILRGLQGVGAAAQLPASLGILAHAFPPSPARSLAFATFSAGAPLGGFFGSAIGGVLTEYTKKSWRSSCYLLTGITIACLLGGAFSVDKDHPSEEKDKRVDWIGALLVTAGLILIIFVLSQGELAPKKWATPYIIALLIVGVLLVAAFLFWQRYLEKVQANPTAYSNLTPPPLLKLSIWTRANGRLGVMMIIAFVNWSGFLAWNFWVMLYYQNYQHYSPIQTVIRLLPMFISGVLCNIFVGFMAARIPLVWMVGFGSTCTMLSCLLFAIIDPRATYWAYGFPAAALSVAGADFVFSAGTLFIAKFSLPHEQSVASALFNTMMQLGTAVGVTVSTVVFNRVGEQKGILDGPTGHPGPPPGSDDSSAPHGPRIDPIVMYHSALWVAFAFCAIGALLGIIAFRGVGVVGGRGAKKSDNEKGRAVGENDEVHEKAVPSRRNSSDLSG